MFFKILRIQLDFFKEDLLKLISIYKNMLEFSQIDIYKNKKIISFQDYDNKIKLTQTINKLSSINYNLEKLKKEMRFL